MVVLPRSILIVLTICQPILLNRLLDYLTESSEPKEKDIGYGLIGAYALVYFGIAISTGFYWYYHYRVLTMIRWCLVSTIGVKTLQLNTHSVEDPKAAVTLMSTDVERIIFGLRSFHEFWANAIQAGFSASFWRGSLVRLLWCRLLSQYYPPCCQYGQVAHPIVIRQLGQAIPNFELGPSQECYLQSNH